MRVRHVGFSRIHKHVAQPGSPETAVSTYAIFQLIMADSCRDFQSGWSLMLSDITLFALIKTWKTC